MKTESDAFREFLVKKGMRVTPEREEILAEVFAEHEHFDVEELILRLRQKGKRASRASVYRTLALLVESGLVQEVFYEDGHMHYEHIYGHEHHCHLRCLKCRKIVEFRNGAVEEAEKRIGGEHNFEVTGHRLEILGFCPDCREKKK
ncbi:MAG: transcriptional repressor [Deltaproteobacteria bacterium]|nr:transcriptional repressor [Deltaproteobacteria bacterium]